MHDLVDYYYGLGALINLNSDTLSTGVGPAGRHGARLRHLQSESNAPSEIVAHERLVGIYRWWLQRSNAQITASYATNGNRSITTLSIAGTGNPQTAVEILFPSTSCSGLQVLTNGTAAAGNGFRTNGSVIKVLVGTVVTNVQISYILDPTASNDMYTAAGGPDLHAAGSGRVEQRLRRGWGRI